jgi:effector-binding domain-containing protein
MGLGEIRAFLLGPSVERLEEFERRTAAEFAERQRVLHHVKRIMEEELVYPVSSRQVPERRYTSRSRRVFVADLVPFICSAFGELGARFGQDGDGAPFVIYHGAVNADSDGPIEVAVPSPDGDRRLPAGEVAYTVIGGDQCAFPEILGAYEAVYQWASANGREVTGPPREIYLAGPASGSGDVERLEIALPIR